MTFPGRLILALSCALVVGCSDDDGPIEDAIDDRIDELDLDDDLVVSRSEWTGGFIIWDLDDDQALAVNEFRFNGNGFETADLNGDGLVTEDEWEDLLDALDLDDNDVLDELEFEPYL